MAAAGELERIIGERPDASALYEQVLALLAEDGVRFDGACWHVTDPLTGLLVRTGVVGDVPGDYRTAVELEFYTDDVAKLDEVGRRAVPVASLVAETGGKPERSLRWREMIRPHGHADELRAAFVDEFGRWGSINLFRAGAPFDERERRLFAMLVPLTAQALRVGARQGPVPDAPVPGVLVLDAHDALEAIDPTATRLLKLTDTLELPGAVHVVTACARHGVAPQRARMHTPDGWLILDATPLAGEPPRVAVVVQPAPSASIADIRLLAAGLSPRERQIALCVIRGETTQQIAAELYLSPWTVQDHLKAIFDKTGVRSRRELLAQLAL